jgi:serine/threonine protein kinase
MLSHTLAHPLAQYARRAIRRLLESELMFAARLDVLADDYLQTLIDRDIKWPPKSMREQLLFHLHHLAAFSERFADQLRAVVDRFPRKSLAALFEMQRQDMGVFQSYRNYWLANEQFTAPDSMPKKALLLQEEVQQRYRHDEYAFAFLASTPLTRLIAYVGAVRDVLLVLGDWLPDEAASLRAVTRTLSELATTSSAPSTPGGGFVAHRTLAAPRSRSGSIDLSRARSPEPDAALMRTTTPPPRSESAGLSEDDDAGARRARLVRSGSAQPPGREASLTAARRIRGLLFGSDEKALARPDDGSESSSSSSSSSDNSRSCSSRGDAEDESVSIDDHAVLARTERAERSADDDARQALSYLTQTQRSTDDDMSHERSLSDLPLRARTPGINSVVSDEASPRSETSSSTSSTTASKRRRRRRAGSVVVYADVPGVRHVPAYLTYDRAAALAERKAIDGQREGGALASCETLDKAASLRIYFRQHYADLLTYVEQRRARMDRIKAQIAQPGVAPYQQIMVYGEHCERETNVLRMRRVRPKLRDFEMLALIGRGGFGEVYLCRQRDTHQVLVIKKVSKATLIERNMVESIRVERQVLKDTKSEWLVRLLYSFQDKHHLYLGMEYVPGGNLSTLLENIDFSEAEARVYAAEMIMAVSELHRLGFIHRDLKPDNFLISSTGHLKLADFGLSKPGANADDSAALKGAPIRVHMVDGAYKAIPVEDNTRARDVVNALVTKLRIPDAERQRWFLFVVGTETQSQRALKPDELLMPIVRRWDTMANRFGIESHHFLLRQLGSSASAAPAARPAAPTAAAAAAVSAPPAAAPLSPPPLSSSSSKSKPSARMMVAAALVKDRDGGDDDDDGASGNGDLRTNFRDLRRQVRSKRTDNKKLVYSVVGTPYYMAPEVITSHGYTHAVDFWSVGCLTYEMLCGVPPFNGNTPDEVFASIMDFENTLQFPADDDEESISATAQRFIRRVLTSADKRYDFRQMRQDEWFASTDFDRLLECQPPFVPSLDNEVDTTYFENAVESAPPEPTSAAAADAAAAAAAGAGAEARPHEFPDFVFTRYSTLFR